MNKHHDIGNKYSFEYDPLSQCAITTWHGNLTEKECYEINHRFLDFITKHNTYKIINDVLIVNEISDEYRRWLADTYERQLYTAGIRFSAVVKPVRFTAAVKLEDIVRDVTNDNITTKYFTILSQAIVWLEGV